MYTTHHPCWDAKNRHNLPEEIPLEYAGIAHCIPSRTKLTPKSEQKSKPEQKSKQEPTPDPEPKSEALALDKPKPEHPNLDVEFEPEASGKLDPAMKIPKPLLDLMEAHGVAAWEIQAAVASRGYYPQDMPISDYDPDFVQGVW